MVRISSCAIIVSTTRPAVEDALDDVRVQVILEDGWP
jgi:hypothetical protein